MIDDPRDKRYFQLQKRDIAQLTKEDIVEYISYCNKMIEFVSDKKSRKGWIELKKELEGRLL